MLIVVILYIEQNAQASEATLYTVRCALKFHEFHDFSKTNEIYSIKYLILFYFH